MNPALPTPIWSQIEESVRYLVAAGLLAPGAALPSVRDLARAERINPNTVAKAYQRLAEEGVVETRRGEGTFVAARPPVDARGRANADAARGSAALRLAGGEPGGRPVRGRVGAVLGLARRRRCGARREAMSTQVVTGATASEAVAMPVVEVTGSRSGTVAARSSRASA